MSSQTTEIIQCLRDRLETSNHGQICSPGLAGVNRSGYLLETVWTLLCWIIWEPSCPFVRILHGTIKRTTGGTFGTLTEPSIPRSWIHRDSCLPGRWSSMRWSSPVYFLHFCSKTPSSSWADRELVINMSVECNLKNGHHLWSFNTTDRFLCILRQKLWKYLPQFFVSYFSVGIFFFLRHSHESPRWKQPKRRAEA